MYGSFLKRYLHGEGIFVGVQALLLLLGARLNSIIVWQWVLLIMAPISLWAWVESHRRFRAIADVPLSRIASAAQGYVELQGVALKRPENPLCSHLTGLPCVWHRYRIEEKRGDRKGWVTESEGESSDCFEIRDSTGTCVVDPEGADIMSAHKQVWITHNRRYTEYLLLPNDTIYALGNLTTLHNSASPLSMREDMSELLAEWKRDKKNLLLRFDRNGDGQIDLGEWEHARAEAKKEVLAQHRDLLVEEGVHVLRKPEGERAYLLSNKSPESLTRIYRIWSWVHLGVFFLLIGFAAKMFSR
jgi:hypothetical protein